MRWKRKLMELVLSDLNFLTQGWAPFSCSSLDGKTPQYFLGPQGTEVASPMVVVQGAIIGGDQRSPLGPRCPAMEITVGCRGYDYVLLAVEDFSKKVPFFRYFLIFWDFWWIFLSQRSSFGSVQKRQNRAFLTALTVSHFGADVVHFWVRSSDFTSLKKVLEKLYIILIQALLVSQ